MTRWKRHVGACRRGRSPVLPPNSQHLELAKLARAERSSILPSSSWNRRTSDCFSLGRGCRDELLVSGSQPHGLSTSPSSPLHLGGRDPCAQAPPVACWPPPPCFHSPPLRAARATSNDVALHSRGHAHWAYDSTCCYIKDTCNILSCIQRPYYI